MNEKQMGVVKSWNVFVWWVEKKSLSLIWFHWLPHGYLRNMSSFHISLYFLCSGWFYVFECCFCILCFPLVLSSLSFRPIMSLSLTWQNWFILNGYLLYCAIWINFFIHDWFHEFSSVIWHESTRSWKIPGAAIICY